VKTCFSFFMRKFNHKEAVKCFQMRYLFRDDRLNGIPLEYQSTVVHVVEDVIDRRFYTDKPFASKEEILEDVCER